jgi:hypothetical protein
MSAGKLAVACAQTGSVAEEASLSDEVEKAKRFLDQAAEKGAELGGAPTMTVYKDPNCGCCGAWVYASLAC